MALTRRSLLKSLGLASGSAALGIWPEVPLPATATPEMLQTAMPLSEENPVPPSRPVTAITLGAGARGNTYGGYALSYPGELKIVGVAEPIPIRNERHSALHQIPEANRFTTWEHVFDRPKFADAVIIATPDRLHYGPCMAALRAGYDVLLEKPISPSETECREILELAQQTGRIVAVCHVLRYAPYFIRLRELVQSGAIGELVSIQHLEPIQHVHMAHSYVRGNWHDRHETAPIILAKSCHDLDILRWIVGKPCTKIVAMGGLKWFRKENAPEGSTDRCMNGCAAESWCPYSAMKIYYRERGWLYVFDLPEKPELQGDAILEYLRTTHYGRCVYRMENNQEDHYVATMEFEGGVTANFSMEAFTHYHGRRTRVLGSYGDIVGDMQRFTLTDFRTGVSTVFDTGVTDDHGGGDWRLVRNFVQAVSSQDAGVLTSTIEASVESHIMGFMAEKSRETGCVEKVKM